MWWRVGNSRRWWSIALTFVMAGWLSLTLGQAHGQTVETPAQFAYLIDLSSNTVLLEKTRRRANGTGLYEQDDDRADGAGAPEVRRAQA